MYGNSYLAPSGLCQNKTTFLQYWEIISLASLHTVSRPFSAGPVLLMRPPCSQLQGNSAFAGHFFSSIPSKLADSDQSGKLQSEKWQFRKKLQLKVRLSFCEVSGGPGSQSGTLGTRFLAGACWAPSESLLCFGIPSGHPWLLDSSEILCWGPLKGNI